MIRTEKITCTHAGELFEGFAQIPAGDGPHPAVLIIHGGLGLNHIVPRTAEKLAEAGYLAVAADMVGPAAQNGGAQVMREASAVFGKNPNLARERTAAWVDVVKALPWAIHNRIAVIGYCFGGHCVLELARSGSDVQAIVSFHGILSTPFPATAGSVKAEIAIYSGGKDPYVPSEQIEAVRQELVGAGASFSITTFSHAHHAFTDPHADMLNMPGLRYDPIAERVSWAGMMALLQLKLRE